MTNPATTRTEFQVEAHSTCPLDPDKLVSSHLYDSYGGHPTISDSHPHHPIFPGENENGEFPSHGEAFPTLYTHVSDGKAGMSQADARDATPVGEGETHLRLLLLQRDTTPIKDPLYTLP